MFSQLSKDLMRSALGDTRGLGCASLSPGEGAEVPTGRWGASCPVQHRQWLKELEMNAHRQ